MKTDASEPFHPLSATALPRGAGPDMRVTVLKPADKPLPFAPLPKPSNPADLREPAATCEPRVTVEREGDFVTAIRIQCTCGQMIELACVYDPTRAGGTKA